MAAAAEIPQSGDDRPFVTVATDARGSTCWVVVGLGQQVRCCSGRRALAVLTEMLASRGIPTP